jgi:hypothetical protein
MGLIVPQFARDILQRFETQTCPFAEHDLAGAFTFARRGNNAWGTFFGPRATGTRTDGTILHVPDIADIDASIIEHWGAARQ